MKYLAVLVSVLAVVAATQQENLEDDLTHGKPNAL